MLQSQMTTERLITLHLSQIPKILHVYFFFFLNSLTFQFRNSIIQ